MSLDVEFLFEDFVLKYYQNCINVICGMKIGDLKIFNPSYPGNGLLILSLTDGWGDDKNN